MVIGMQVGLGYADNFICVFTNAGALGSVRVTLVYNR